jgi:hypothetical protein
MVVVGGWRGREQATKYCTHSRTYARTPHVCMSEIHKQIQTIHARTLRHTRVCHTRSKLVCVYVTRVCVRVYVTRVCVRVYVTRVCVCSHACVYVHTRVCARCVVLCCVVLCCVCVISIFIQRRTPQLRTSHTRACACMQSYRTYQAPRLKARVVEISLRQACGEKE